MIDDTCYCGLCEKNARRHEKEVLELRARVERLRGAHEFIADGCLVPPDGGAPELGDAIKASKKALASTPAADLRAHDAEIMERAAGIDPCQWCTQNPTECTERVEICREEAIRKAAKGE